MEEVLPPNISPNIVFIDPKWAQMKISFVGYMG